jgi:hypothetical protein
MPNVSLHLIPFIEIVAAVIVAPFAGYYTLRGWRRRHREVVTGQRPTTAIENRKDERHAG